MSCHFARLLIWSKSLWYYLQYYQNNVPVPVPVVGFFKLFIIKLYMYDIFVYKHIIICIVMMCVINECLIEDGKHCPKFDI